MNALPPFTLHQPTSLAEACTLLADPDATALAGGTDLLVHLRSGRRAAGTLVSLRRVAEIGGITAHDGGWRIGAGVSLSDLMTHEGLLAAHPVLADAARYMGSLAIRHLGTVGGNLCNASPAADLPPPLLALDASVEIADATGTRALPLAQLFAGPSRTVLQPGELCTAVELPARGPGWRVGFERLDMRRAMDIAIVSVAAAVQVADGTIVDARVALGAVAPTPLRVPAAESALTGCRVAELDAGLGAAAAAAMAACRPITDIRASANYRRAMVGVLTRRALAGAVAHAGDDTRDGTVA